MTAEPFGPSGWVILDKPAPLGSTTASGIVRRLFGAAKAGHFGTLDPLATGVLPIALGEATKAIPYLSDDDKEYRFGIRWGIATATDDAEGEPVAASDIRPDEAAIRAALPCFTGFIEQVPPDYSAIKVKGKRAYDLARAAVPVVLPARRVQIHDFVLLRMDGPDGAYFEVRCGKGTYMRSLARDLARALGTVGHIVALHRVRAGKFHENSAISLDKLRSLGHIAALRAHLLPVATALDDIPALAVAEAEARLLRNGQSIPLLAACSGALGIEPALPSGATAQIVVDGRLLAVVRRQEARLEPVRIFNLAT